MKRIKTLVATAILIALPGLAMAGVDDYKIIVEDDVFDGFDGFDDVAAVVPEPGSALVMGAGLIVAGLATRKRRR